MAPDLADPPPEPILVAGEALVDIVQPVDGPAQEHVGGSPANVAVGLATLGHPTSLATHLADDERGRVVTAYLRERNVALVSGSLSAEQTPTATARLDPEGVASYVFELTWELPRVPVEQVTHLHTGSIGATLEPGGSAVFDLMSRARDGATISYDPNLRPGVMGSPHDVRARIEECVGRADVVKASSEDLEWLYAGAPLTEVTHLWGLLGPSLLVITQGADGVLVHLSGSDRTHQEPATSLTVVDTVGAGDSFMAGLLSGLLDGGLLGGPQARQRLRSAGLDRVLPAVGRAIACASYTVQRAGAAAPNRYELGG